MNALREPVLDVTGLGARYPGHEVFHDLNLRIRQGEILAVVGASGSGKTTLLKSLNLLHLPFQGTIRFKGELVFTSAVVPAGMLRPKWMRLLIGESHDGSERKYSGAVDAYRRNFGFVFQEFNLWPDLTLWQNIAAPLVWGGRGREEIRERVTECAQLVQIEGILDRFPQDVSGGQKQRAAIARALAPDPAVLLLDEITSALDPDLVYGILEIIGRLATVGRTMVIVTHHMSFARRVATKITFMRNGMVLPPTDSENFFGSEDAHVREFLRHIENL